MGEFVCYSFNVSVPSRGILFPNNGKTVEPNDGMIGFRPLSGHLISKSTIRTVKTLNDGDMFPSPLGASYFQIKGDFIMEENRNEFPSPLGASYFQIRCSRPVRVSKTSFPSPLGASYFQIRRNDVYRKNYRWSVSVPSRGILFPNLYEDYNEYIRVYEFPSPLGASYFQIRRLFSFINDEYGFRPLSGHLISKLRFDELFDRKCEVFPSPLGASYFQISHDFFGNIDLEFPSPLGASYFQISLGMFPNTHGGRVSVPSRGILFPNLFYVHDTTQERN